MTEPVLIKLSGTIFKDRETLIPIIEQIKTLQTKCQIGIVVGGGNFFRGTQHGKRLGLTQPSADAVGMLATNMNGLILRDLLQGASVPCSLLSACAVPGVINPISIETLQSARKTNALTIFAGGSGNPFFSTDTTAVLRALQIGAQTVLKATNVDGVYDADPATTPTAQKLTTVSYQTVVEKKLRIMDLTAITMAAEHNVCIRVFNIFTPNALLNVITDKNIGSTINSIN